MWGEVYSPTRNPAFSNEDAILIATEPFPFVPAIWIDRNALWGWLSSRSFSAQASNVLEPFPLREKSFCVKWLLIEFMEVGQNHSMVLIDRLDLLHLITRQREVKHIHILQQMCSGERFWDHDDPLLQ